MCEEGCAKAESSHVGHLRSHPDAYRGVVAFFLQQVGV